MDIKKLNNRFSINEWIIYNHPLLKPFIDASFIHHHKCNQYKLFHYYILRFNRTREIFKTYAESHYSNDMNILFNENGNINFRNNKVKTWFKDWKVVYVGLTYTKKKSISPIFLCLNDFYKDEYVVNGFSLGEDPNERDIKEFSQIKNKIVRINNDGYQKESLYGNIKFMSDLTKEYIK